jgi:SsrA-binding protein
MPAPAESVRSNLATNRKARHDYHVIETIEAGIELRGTEVKSARSGEVSLPGGFARVTGGEILLEHITIATYPSGNRFNHDPERPRRLLLHRREIRRLQARVEQEGYTLVPLRMYLKHGLVKVELGVCKGKQKYDKREAILRRDADRQAARAVSRGVRRRV